MININLTRGYKIKSLSKEHNTIVEKLCNKCSDYYMLHDGIVPVKEEIDDIFITLPPNKDYKDKFVLGIYNKFDELIGIVDLVKDFPNTGEWMLGLMLIEPQSRDNGLGKIANESLVKWAKSLGAKSFRIGVIEDNYRGINFWSSLGYKCIKKVNMAFKKRKHLVNVMRLNFYK